ncbi:aldehyde dehydrogenase family protein, partial [Streptomyces sp. S6]
MTDALVSGILAGYGIALPVGAMSVLVVTLASRVSLRRGMAAALGVATADGLYALAAVVGGTALSRLIAPAAGVFEAVAAGVLVVNTFSLDMLGPFGGYKNSGLGREFGPEGFGEYLEHK